MSHTRNTKAQLNMLPALLLCLMWLFVQGAKLHVHYQDCGHVPAVNGLASNSFEQHPTHARVHLVTDSAQHSHDMTGLSELDLSPEGLLKNLAGLGELLLAVIGVCLLLLPLFAPIRWQPPRQAAPQPWRYIHCPPPRAPPQR